MYELIVVMKDKPYELVMMFDKDIKDITEDDIKAAIDAGKYELADLTHTIDFTDTHINMGFGEAGKVTNVFPREDTEDHFWCNLFSTAFAK